MAFTRNRKYFLNPSSRRLGNKGWKAKMGEWQSQLQRGLQASASLSSPAQLPEA